MYDRNRSCSVNKRECQDFFDLTVEKSLFALYFKCRQGEKTYDGVQKNFRSGVFEDQVFLSARLSPLFIGSMLYHALY
jgi:hypothetical protein